MHGAKTHPAIGLSSQFALLTVLAWTVGLSGLGWGVGIACGIGTNAALTRALDHHGVARLGPADRVTLTRATLAGGVAALSADALWRQGSVTMLVGLTAIALCLDAIDGWVARRTATVTAFGARFDMEADAFLIMVLSVYVARSTGAWVLTIGAARYAFVAAGWLLPWLRVSAPVRYWGKVVATTQGVVLSIAAADVLPRFLAATALTVALAMLAESFGREVWWLWCSRPLAVGWAETSAAEGPHQPRVGRAGHVAIGARSG